MAEPGTVQREAIQWCIKTAGARVHGTTRKQPLVQFESFERGALRRLTGERFDTPEWGDVKVHPDHHIHFGLALYSVPHEHSGKPTIGKQVTARGDRRLVRIYLGGVLIKTHPRKPPGGRSTDFGDYPQEKTEYAMRDANSIIRRAKQRGPSVGRFTEELLSGDFPWAKLRQAQKLLRLVDKYGADRVDAGCRRALSFDLVDVRRVERIIVQALEHRPDSSKVGEPANVIQLPLKFLRPAKSLSHTPTEEEKDNGSPTVPQDRA